MSGALGRASRRRKAVAAWLAVAVSAACDLSGPGGPAQITGTVTGDPTLGGAVVDITWSGVTGFQGRGSTQAYSGPVPDSLNRHRVILVDAAGGDLRFTIDLEESRLDGPVVSVVSAVGTDNLPLAVADLRVLLER